VRVTPVVTVGAVGAAAVVARRLVVTRRGRGRRENIARWHFVTINRPPEEVAPGGKLPDPLAALGGAVETTVRLAPGGRGTELGARLVDGEPSGSRPVRRLAAKDPTQDVRSALREARQIIEVGEVLLPDRPGTTRSTLRGKPLELALRRAGSEGLL